jgi:conjugative relaxase-like TrwC/TraI family protein
VRFVVTAIGAEGGRTVGQVVDDVVRYLDKPRPAARVVEGESAPGASDYYADGSNEPGRWLGEGARALGLSGGVDRDELARLLSGRDPSTGERLIGAAGSAGRRATLGVGAHSAGGIDGERLYDRHDASRALGVEEEELDRLIETGAARAFSVVLQVATGRAVAPPLGPFLVAQISGGGVLVTEGALAACETAMTTGASPEEVEAAGAGDDLYSLAEASRIAGVTRRYLRRLALASERHRAEIDAERAAGRAPRRAYLDAIRGTRGQWLVSRQELVEFLRRRTTPAVRVGYDVTLTTEKSLSVLALLGTAQTRNGVLEAIRTGNDAGMAWLEERAARARVAGDVVRTTGWSAASFLHLTSRALDPFAHFHNVIAASVATSDGDRRTLDARHLYANVAAASAIATVEMRKRLTDTLGVGWRPSASGGWEIDGIPDPVLREFSRRRNEIDEAIAHLEAEIGRSTTLAELQQVVANTRPPKQQADAADLASDWHARAVALGFDPAELASCCRTLGTRPVPGAAELAPHVFGPNGVCADTSVFTYSDLLRTLADSPRPSDHQPGTEDRAVTEPIIISATELQELAATLLQSPDVVHLDDPDVTALELARFTTRDILATQARIIDGYRSGLGAGAAVVPHSAVDHCLTQSTLAPDQADLVRRLTTSGHRIQCAIGRAGSGKTTALATAADAWHTTGYRVVGAAVKGEAARLLGDAAGIPSETVAWYLVPRNVGAPPVDHRTVLIVDEASTLSDHDLDALVRLCTSTGATLRLIGDPVQHSAVTPGGMFRVLCEKHPTLTPQLTISRRLQHPADRAAADHLREGRVTDALRVLHDAGHLHYAADDAALYAKLLDSWWRDHQAGRPHPLVERSNHRRRQLNRLARRLLQANGELGPDVVDASGGRAFAVGDRVTARRPARGLHPAGQPKRYVRNGMTGTVVGVAAGTSCDEDVLHVSFKGVGVVDVPRDFFDDRHRHGRSDAGLDHAYALTSYAVQGATFDASTSHIDENSTRAEAYVDLTRGRWANQLYATRQEDALDGEHLPKAPPPPLEVTLAARLAKSGEVTAWEIAHADNRQVGAPAAARRNLERP